VTAARLASCPVCAGSVASGTLVHTVESEIGVGAAKLREVSSINRPGRVPVREQLAVWLSVGTQSIGGGPATLFLMRRLLVQRKRWIDDTAFLQDWMLARLSPGVTLIALIGLLGHRVDGRRGAAISLSAVLLPAAAVTAVLAAAVVLLVDNLLVGHALEGMEPMTIGMTFAMTTVLARSALRRRRWILDGALIGVCFVLGLASTSPIVILVAGAIVGVLFLGDSSSPPAQIER
jgi:chromate transporter